MRNLSRYFLVGACAAGVDFAFFLCFSTWLNFNYLLVGASGFVLATFVNYVLSILWVFESGARFTRRREVFYVYLISLVGLGLHMSILAMVVELDWAPKPVAKLLATGLVFFWNYSARRYYVFRPRSESPADPDS